MPPIFANAFEDERELGEELREGACALHDLALGALGPCGRHRIIQADPDGGANAATTTGVRMLQGIAWTHPAARLLVEATAVAQHRACGDGGLLSACIAARLARDALIADPGLSYTRHRWIAGWQAALRWALGALGQRLVGDGASAEAEADEALRPGGGRSLLAAASAVPLALPLSWSDMGGVTALVRSVVTPKLAASGLSRYEAEVLVNTAARAFISAVGDDPRVPPVVRVLGLEGHPVSESRCVEALLLDTPLAPEDHGLLPVSRAAVAVFLCDLGVQAQAGALETAEGQVTECEVEIAAGAGAGAGADGGAAWDPAEVQLEALEGLVAELCASAGVGVVACQRTIHPRVRAECRRRGVLALERLSALHVGAFCRAAGATPMGARDLALVPEWRRHLGALASVRVLREAGRDLLQATPVAPAPGAGEGPQVAPLSAPAPVSTILLGGPNGLLLQEMKASMEAAVQVLNCALRVQMVTPGGGCTEVMLAHRLRAKSALQFRPGSPEAAAAESLCLALEVAAGKLAGGLANPTELVDAVRGACLASSASCAAAATSRASDRGGCRAALYGWDHYLGQVQPVVHYEYTLPGAAAGPSADRLVHRVSGARILDSLPAKAFALSSALEAACMVCRLSGSILAGDAS